MERHERGLPAWGRPASLIDLKRLAALFGAKRLTASWL